MTEKIYQRPPAKEETKEFLKKVKFAIFFPLITLTALVLFIGAFYLFQFKSTQDLVEYAIRNLSILSTLILLILLTLAIMVCSYDAEMSRYFIYKRYRFGHFSNMMVAYISTFALQVIAIFVAVSFKVVIPLVVFELLASIYLFIELKKSKDSRPPLARPLTSEENECRKEIIEGLVDIAAQEYDAFTFNEISRIFAFFATFLEQKPEKTEKLFTDLKEQYYSDEEQDCSDTMLLLKFVKKTDFDGLDTKRYKVNYNRAFELFHRIISKSPTKTERSVRKEFYDYFE